MKKIIILLVVLTLMAAVTPITFADEDPVGTSPEEGEIQKDVPLKSPSVYNEGFDTTGAAVFGATLLGLIGIMAASDDDTAHSGHE